MTFLEARREFERRYFERLLMAHGGRVARVAAAAGITWKHCYRILHRLGLADKWVKKLSDPMQMRQIRRAA